MTWFSQVLSAKSKVIATWVALTYVNCRMHAFDLLIAKYAATFCFGRLATQTCFAPVFWMVQLVLHWTDVWDQLFTLPPLMHSAAISFPEKKRHCSFVLLRCLRVHCRHFEWWTGLSMSTLSGLRLHTILHLSAFLGNLCHTSFSVGSDQTS